VAATSSNLGTLVAFTRLVAPNPRPSAAAGADAAPQAADQAQAEPEMALAA
jgi:hypothetical protein